MLVSDGYRMWWATSVAMAPAFAGSSGQFATGRRWVDAARSILAQDHLENSDGDRHGFGAAACPRPRVIQSVLYWHRKNPGAKPQFDA